MKLPGLESLVRRIVLALPACVAIVVLAPSEASAGCSHLVIWRHSAIGGPDGLGLDALRELGAIPGARHGSDAPANPPKPCTGALCSGSPAVPILPEPPIPPSFDHWGLVIEGADAPGPALLHRSLDEPVVRATHLGAGVFHPPRAN